MALFQRLPLRLYDLIIIGVVLLGAVAIGVSFLLFAQQKEDLLICEISQNNIVIATIPLQAGTYQLVEVAGDYHNVIEILDNRVRFLHATCANQVCVHTGWVQHPYQTAACLPNRVLVQIIGGASPELDAIA